MISVKNFLKRRYLLESSEAVTEVLDFVVICGILILAFSIIGVAGYPVLKNAQDARYIENTRQSFIVLAENLNKIALGETHSQSVELKMYGGTLSVATDGNITINATGSSGNITESSILGSIQNSIGDVVIAYQGTGGWIKYPSGKILNVYRPLITNQGDVLVIPVVKISGSSSIGGTGMSRIRVEGEPDVIIWSNVSNVTVTITGDYTSGWEDYFRNMKGMDWEIGTNYTARLNTTGKLDVYILKTIMFTEIE